MKELVKKLIANPYENYIYSYPHKKAYGEFSKPIQLEVLWGNSASKDLTLYIHIPFCMNKCGYCNLLSTTSFGRAKMNQYVDQMMKEMTAIRQFLGIRMGEESPFSSVILGGGTPTIIEDFELKRLVEAISTILYVDFEKVFFSTETSPRTITKSKLNILKEYHIDRVSMGVQSFNNEELNNIYRRESVNEIEKALQLLFKENIPIKNLDLIYGIPFQTMETWEASLQKIIEYKPEEIYLYPLYIREKTGLYEKYKRDIGLMGSMYEFAKNILRENNYIQTSMRNFIRADWKKALFPEYSCQENEMIGIGCGARSYRENVHYSRKYAVEEDNINKIIEEYLNEKDFSVARYGYQLSEDELKRRYILKSILKISGLDIEDYHSRFNSFPVAEFKELKFLLDNDFLLQKESQIYPTEKGIRCSDAIGNLFISGEVKQKVDNYQE
jgi:oxygen-independent coproporphyrinogen-3 oxidase